MNDARIGDDLEYVRDVVRQSKAASGPASIYFLWAVISLVGFSLPDLAPRWVGRFWIVASPAGFLLSAILGYRYHGSIGQVSRELGYRHMLHWGSLLVIIFAAAGLGIAGVVSWDHFGQVILLLLALSYFLAGVHLDRAMVWIGLLVFIAYFATFAMPRWGWTISGVGVALGMMAAGVIRGGRGARAA